MAIDWGTTPYYKRDWYRLNVSQHKEVQLKIRVPTQWGIALDHYLRFDDPTPIAALIDKYYDYRPRTRGGIHY